MKTFHPPPQQPRIVEKRSTKAAKATGKGKTAPITAKRRGGAAVDVSRPRNRWEEQTWDLVELAAQTALASYPSVDEMSGVAALLWHDRMWEDFENRLEGLRPTKAAKPASKATTAPAAEKRGGGTADSKKTPHEGWRGKAEVGLWNAVEAWLGRKGLRPEAKARLRKVVADRLPKILEEMEAAHAEKTERRASMPPQTLMQAYDAGVAERSALAEAEAGLAIFQKSRTGLDAARVELMEEEAGVDIAAHVAAEHAATPKQEWAIARALEELGWWLVEAIPSKGGKKARWEKIIPIAQQGKLVFFTAQHRYMLTPDGKRQREKSPIRQTISTAASQKLLRHLQAKLDNAQASGDNRVSSAARIMKKWDKGQAAVVHFLTLFHQRCSGTRREVLVRRQRLAEAIAHRIERPRKVGDTKEKASKTQENDFAWIRSRRRTP